MHRYKIFLLSGEIVEILAKSVIITSDKQGIRFDFLKIDEPRCNAQPSAIFYCEYIRGWAEVRPQPETGHWIMHQDHRECSKCGVYLLKDMPRNSYCPNCGTRMTESEDEINE